MKKINIIKLVILIPFMFLTACDDILDVTPDNRTEIDSLEKISELLVNAYPQAIYAPFLEPMSDNADDKSFSATENDLNNFMYEWSDFFETANDTPTNYWNDTYAAISQANQALLSLDELGYTDVNQRGEALICRAYGHFMLVNMFAKAYNPETASTTPGITYIKTPENILFPQYTRNTIQEVYDNIEADLVEGLKYIGNELNYGKPKFHFTTRSANAFASRFYLVTGEWQKVVDHSNKVLGAAASSADLRDYANQYRGPGLTYDQRRTRFSSALEPANLLIVVGGSLFARTHAGARFQLSGSLAQTLFFSANPAGLAWSENVYGGTDLVYNVPKYIEYFKTTNQGAGTGSAFIQIPLLTTDEVILNRAEAHAMLGNFQLATDDLNAILSVRSQAYTAAAVLTPERITNNFPVDANYYTPFYSITPEALPFVNVILRTRRTIFYNEGYRWFDVKRHDIEVVHRRDVTPRVSETLTLPKGDNKRALQIPTEAQARGIEANPR